MMTFSSSPGWSSASAISTTRRRNTGTGVRPFEMRFATTGTASGAMSTDIPDRARGAGGARARQVPVDAAALRRCALRKRAQGFFEAVLAIGRKASPGRSDPRQGILRDFHGSAGLTDGYGLGTRQYGILITVQ
jgi:hypothetical protein